MRTPARRRAVPRVSPCGASLRSTMRGLRPWRRSSQAANNPAGPAPTIRTVGAGADSPILTRMQQHGISSLDGSFVRSEGSVVTAAGILQCFGPQSACPACHSQASDRPVARREAYGAAERLRHPVTSLMLMRPKPARRIKYVPLNRALRLGGTATFRTTGKASIRPRSINFPQSVGTDLRATPPPPRPISRMITSSHEGCWRQVIFCSSVEVSVLIALLFLTVQIGLAPTQAFSKEKGGANCSNCGQKLRNGAKLLSRALYDSS
jgi:hypothetical protein